MNRNRPVPILNPRFISFIEKRQFFVLILFACVYGVIPLNESAKILFCILGMFFVVIGIFIQSIMHKDWSIYPHFILFRVLFRLLCFLFGIISFGAFVIRMPNYHITVEVVFSWCLPLILLIATVEFLILMIIYIDNLSLKYNKRKKLFFIFTLLILYIVVYVFSGISFSYGYTTLLGTVEGKGIESMDSFYLSFLIANTLPINDDSLSEYIRLINENNNLRAYQYFHVYTNKLIELTIVAIIFKMLLDLFKMKSVE